jgi:hypothetical protein
MNFLIKIKINTMKKSFCFIAISALILGFISCIKDDGTIGSSILNASKTSKIKKGEPVTFTMSKTPDESFIKWEVVPDKSAQIDANGNSATILFNTSGFYKITASLGALKASTGVSVLDSLFNPAGVNSPIIDALKGDQVDFIVSKIDSMGISGISLSFSTKMKYQCLNHLLLFDLTTNGSDYKITLNGIYRPVGDFCIAGEARATAYTSLYPVSNGNHVFEVVLEGTTYRGSFVKSGSKFTFTWPYTQSVTIAPLVIN